MQFAPIEKGAINIIIVTVIIVIDIVIDAFTLAKFFQIFVSLVDFIFKIMIMILIKKVNLNFAFNIYLTLIKLLAFLEVLILFCT